MKRDKNLRNLSSDHHQALALVRKINNVIKEQSITSEFIEHVKAVFIDELEPHFVLEEQSLIPELKNIGADSLVDQTLQEHKQMRELIEKINDHEALKQFAELLKAHVKFEENELFNICQDDLDLSALERIGQICSR